MTYARDPALRPFALDGALLMFDRDSGTNVLLEGEETAGRGTCDDWPQYSDDNRPRVAAIGTQVIVHHDYTVSLPPTFGELFYKKGGRVEHEENHAHQPIVAVATFWWGWTEQAKATRDEQCPRLLAALTAEDGVLAKASGGAWPPAWRLGGDPFGEAPLTVGALFDPLAHLRPSIPASNVAPDDD